MLWMTFCGRALLLAFCLFASTAQAELPNPNSFAWAVERGDVKKVKEWFDEGLDPEFVGSQLGTGLMIAAWNGNVEMMALFVERGANPRRANKNGEQPLQLAAWKGHMDAAKWLLAHGASLNREGKQWGALHYAVFNGHDDLVKYLIAQGAQVNAPSPNGSTPLMIAAREGKEDLAKVLLEWPAGKRDSGESTLACAMRELQEETGYTACEWAYGGEIHNAAAYSSESIWIWFARGLVAGPPRLDHGEFVETVTLTEAELAAIDLHDGLPDVKTLIGLHWLQQWHSGRRPLTWHSAQHGAAL